MFHDVMTDLLAFGIQNRCKLRLDKGAEQVRHGRDVVFAHFLAFGAEALAHLLPKGGGIDKLHHALALPGAHS